MNKGVVMVLIAAVCWGLSGIAAQMFFENFKSTPGFLVSVRLLSAGVIMIIFECFLHKVKGALSIWVDKKDRLALLIFGFLGMLGVQYTFFTAIHYGNSATATLLQYLGPVFIIIFVSLRVRRMPGIKEFAAFVFALIGIFLMTTSGSVHSLTIKFEALVWGILSALSAAFYTLYPAKLLQTWGPVPIVGWSMIIGGVGLSLFHPPWLFDWNQASLLLFSLLAFIVIVGTLIPFYLFLGGLCFVTPAQASILSSVEPLTILLLGTLVLHIPMNTVQLIGSLFIIMAVTVLAINSANNHPIGNKAAASDK